MVLSCVKYGPCGKDLDSWINIMLFTHLFASIAGLFLGAVILQNKLSYDKGFNYLILSMIILCGTHLLFTHYLMYGLHKKHPIMLLSCVIYSVLAAVFFIFVGLYIGIYFQKYGAYGLESFAIFIFFAMGIFMLYTAVTIHSQRLLYIIEEKHAPTSISSIEISYDNIYQKI